MTGGIAHAPPSPLAVHCSPERIASTVPPKPHAPDRAAAFPDAPSRIGSRHDRGRDALAAAPPLTFRIHG